MQISNVKTITDLSRLPGRVYVYFPTEDLAKQFMQQAEAEGFTFGDGIRPTERAATAVMAVNPNHTINYVGANGHMAFGAGMRTVGSSPLLRFSYGANGFFSYEKSSMKEK